MLLHANAKLGLAGRLALVRAVEEGLSLKAAAAAFSVSPATAHRWWHRWLDGGRQAQALMDRSSRPKRSPRLLAVELQERICDCRRKTGWGPRLVAGATGFAHSTVDDHSRLAYVELHDDEKAETVTGFVERALAFFAEHGITAKRLMTDNGFSYVKNRSLRELLARNGIRHLTTQPYRPRTNGKVERFHQTMAREWAYGLSYRSHRQRNQALPHWLDHYNTRRPHSSLGGRPPISRVHNVRG